MVGGLRVAAQSQVGKAEVAQGVGLTGPVAELVQDGLGLLEVACGLPVPGLVPLHDTQAGQSAGFTRPVADLPAQRERGGEVPLACE